MTTSPSLSAAAPDVLFDAEKLNILGFDLLPDGAQLAIIRGEDESDEARNCAVVLNWTNELLDKMSSAK